MKVQEDFLDFIFVVLLMCLIISMNWKISNGAPHRSVCLSFTKQPELLSLELHFLTFLYLTSNDCI